MKEYFNLTRTQAGQVIRILTSYKVKIIESESVIDMGTVAYATKKDDIYYVFLHSSIENKYRGLLLLHELGHVDFGHFEHDLNKLYEEIRHIALHNFGKAVNSFEHDILNICMDLQVNSTLFNLKDIKNLYETYGIQTVSMYPPAQAGFDFKYYYTYVIDKFDFKKKLKVKEFIKAVESWVSQMIKGGKDVTAEVKSEIKQKADDSDSDEGQGSGMVNSPKEKVGTQEENLLSYLNTFIETSNTTRTDSMRLYNRQSRGNTDLLYNSLKRQRVKNLIKIIILVDVSYSMNKNLIKRIIAFFRGHSQKFHIDSRVVTWTTGLVEDFKISEDVQDIQIGGGTHLASGIKYCLDKYNPNKILHISDFQDDLQAIEFISKKSGCKFYGINTTKSDIKKSLPSYVSIHNL